MQVRLSLFCLLGCLVLAGLPAPAGAQRYAFVGATGTNQFVVAWESNGQNGSGVGVFGQRHDFAAGDAITVVSPNSNVKWLPARPACASRGPTILPSPTRAT
jgi:hypothetical protein